MGNERTYYPGGVWPVMVTPFCYNGEIDYGGLERLIDWYIENGCSGLFTVCQSSEMFYLSLEERLKLAEATVKMVAGRVPVIASGNISDTFEKRVEEINLMAKTGVDAIILITNQFANAEESDEVWINNCMEFLGQIDTDIPLGFYECPKPYKRLISLENLKKCAESGRFYFLKDTCCDTELIKKRLEVISGSKLQLYNANTATLLESLKDGAAGFCGVMANFHPDMYNYLCKHYEEENIEYLQDFLTVASWIESQYYPVNAKYHLQKIESIPMTTYSRGLEEKGLTDTYKKEVIMLEELTAEFRKYYTEGEW